MRYTQRTGAGDAVAMEKKTGKDQIGGIWTCEGGHVMEDMREVGSREGEVFDRSLWRSYSAMVKAERVRRRRIVNLIKG